MTIVASTSGLRRSRQRWDVYIGASDRSGTGAWTTIPFMNDSAAVIGAERRARRFDGSHDPILLVNRDTDSRWWLVLGADGRELIRRPA